MVKQETINELVEEMSDNRLFFTKEEFFSFCSEKYPGLSKKETEHLSNAAMQFIKAINYLEKRFPKGSIQIKMALRTYPKVPFNYCLFAQAVKKINQNRANNQTETILAFPWILKKPKPSLARRLYQEEMSNF